MKSEKEILEYINGERSENTLMKTLDIEYTSFTYPDELVAKMPVTPKVHQPVGFLHGGATVALAETVGSTLSAILVHENNQFPVGLEIAANHVRSIREGTVFGKAKVLHKGRSTHLVQVEITDQDGNLISMCKITNFIRDKK